MRSLAQWLDYQLRIHARSVELGLDRVREVWQRMGAPAPAPVVITVGGTNGKGSTVAFLEAMLRADGKRVGAYTSPHLLRYNERVRVLGDDIDDASLVDAFERIELARAEIPLTYFEFGTLAALWIFAQSQLDVAVLEVGLGGRLDAINIIDADVAIVTTIDLDHQDWLGNDVDSIGREKAGIFRIGRPAVIGSALPPDGLLDEAVRIGAQTMILGRDYLACGASSGWKWQAGDVSVDLPDPMLAAGCQRSNAAAAIAALYCLRGRLGWSPSALASGVSDARVAGRLQNISRASSAPLIVDVAHNPQAARVLAQWLAANPINGRTLAVFSALSDKDIGGIVLPLLAHVDRWFIGGLAQDTERGLAVEDLRARISLLAPDAQLSTGTTIDMALDAAAANAGGNDRIVAFGSFFVAAAALAWVGRTS